MRNSKFSKIAMQLHLKTLSLAYLHDIRWRFEDKLKCESLPEATRLSDLEKLSWVEAEIKLREQK